MQTTTRGRRYIKTLVAALAAVLTLSAHADWKVDFSRRQQVTRQQDMRLPASTSEFPQTVEPGNMSVPDVPSEAPVQKEPEAPGFFQSLFESKDVAAEIVVLNTEKGFVPSNIRVKRGQSYKIHVVNVNEQEKNVSFVLDSFSEHHATYFGKIKTFVIKPQREGVYRFVSPETSAQGKLVVYPDGPADNRMPASE